MYVGSCSCTALLFTYVFLGDQAESRWHMEKIRQVLVETWLRGRCGVFETNLEIAQQRRTSHFKPLFKLNNIIAVLQIWPQ